MSPATAIKRSVIFVHRWLGVALCVLFLIWFPSGIGMMYWDFPGVGAADRLEHAAPLDAATITLSPVEAFEKSGMTDVPASIRLNTFDGRPAYRFRDRDGETIIYADTGEQQVDVPAAMRLRVASAWTKQPATDAREVAVTEVDQWTVGGALRTLRPLWKYSWPNGDEVYVAGRTGEVMQATTRGSRLGAWVGAIPHWLYFTQLRKHQPVWSQVVIWTSGIGTVSAILGVVIGIWMYSPAKRYRYAAAPTSIPYRGQKRWHTLFGLIFGLGAVTWAFSGMLSMDPFPQTTGGPNGGRRPGAGGITQALRGRPAALRAFAGKDPRQALQEIGTGDVKELEFASFSGTPYYQATLAGGNSRVVPLDAAPKPAFDNAQIEAIVRRTVPAASLTELRQLDQYDAYYLDRRRQRPLPVILAHVNDAAGDTRYYVDSKTGRVVSTYNSRNWVNRWLYHGLHSLDFPWLYNHRPLWDIVVILFMSGGTALCVTSLILAWRVLGKTLARMTPVSEDLALETE